MIHCVEVFFDVKVYDPCTPFIQISQCFCHGFMTVPVGTKAIAVGTEQRIVFTSKHPCNHLLNYPVNDRRYSERPEFVAVGFWNIYPPDRQWLVFLAKDLSNDS